MLDKVTFDKHVMSWKGILKVLYNAHLQNLIDSLYKINGPQMSDFVQ